MHCTEQKKNRLLPACCATLLAGTAAPMQSGLAMETLFDISAGPRIDELHWSISGEPSGPNILSEVVWRSVDSAQLALGFQGLTDGGVLIDSSISLGKIYDGHVNDTDYTGDNRTGAFAFSEADTVDDDVMDFSFAIGRAFPVTDAESTAITPLVGFSYHEQNFDVAGPASGVSTASSFPAVDIVDANYEAEWWSTFIGVQVEHRGNRWDTWGRVEYHNVDYEATIDWGPGGNPANPTTIKQKSDGSGPIYEIGARYRYSQNLAFNASFTWWNWDTDSGTHRSIFSNGSVSSMELNTVQWEQNAVMLGITFTSP